MLFRKPSHVLPLRRVARILRHMLISLGIVGVSVGVVLYVTSPVPGRRPRSSETPHRSSGSGDDSLQRHQARTAGPQIPLYSEDWLDDSGYGFSMQYSRPVSDPQSLEQVRTSLEGRGQRGILKIDEELKTVDRRTPQGRARALQLNVIAGLLHMSVGEFVEADGRFTEAQQADPACPAALRSNIEALRGVAALRRGEAENCVACCNEASCIFPLAAEAVHLRPSGSREAIKHFSTYLEQRPEDLGVQWLLNVAHMTLGTYPDMVPKEYLIPMEPDRTESEVVRLTNIAGRVGLAMRGANMAGGAIVDDFTGDGLLDIFTSTIDPTQGCALFVNQGDGMFEDRSTSAGLAPQGRGPELQSGRLRQRRRS